MAGSLSQMVNKQP